MNAVRTSVFSLISLCLVVTAPALGQYYPGGMRPGMGGLSQPTSSDRPLVPNLAGDLANKETKWLRDNLNLDKEQAKAVKKLNNEYAEQQQAAIRDIIGTSGKPGPETGKQIADMMLMFNEEKEDRLKTILTAGQWTTYQAKKPAMQQEVGGFRPPAPKAPGAAPDSTAGPAGSGKQ